MAVTVKPGAVVAIWGGQTILVRSGRVATAMIASDRRSRMLLLWAMEGGGPVVAELVQNLGAEDAGRRSLKACGRSHSCLLSTLNGGR
jgi:phosphoribosylformylglycinamidine (FGAM) synthase-like enzyme